MDGGVHRSLQDGTLSGSGVVFQVLGIGIHSVCAEVGRANRREGVPPIVLDGEMVKNDGDPWRFFTLMDGPRCDVFRFPEMNYLSDGHW